MHLHERFQKRNSLKVDGSQVRARIRQPGTDFEMIKKIFSPKTLAKN
jgi:hypothetical protein